MKSNIEYFWGHSVKLILIALGYALFLGLFILDQEDGMGSLVRVFMMGCIIMGMAYQIALYKKEVPLAISLGSTRKNLTIGLCFYDICSVAMACVITVILALVLAKDVQIFSLVVWTLMMNLFAQSLGILIGIVTQKFGKTAGIVLIIIFSGLGGGLAGFMSIILIRDNINFVINEIVWYVFTGSIVVWMIFQFIQAKYISKFAY